MHIPRPTIRLLLALVLLLAGGLLAWRFFTVPVSPPPPTRQPVPVAAVPSREVILYFGAADGTHLEPENRQVAGCRDEQQCLEKTVTALIAGPDTERIPVLPPDTVLHGVTVSDGGLARLDFDRELIAGHPGGSAAELLTVYALADTLAANFPYIRQIRILVDGQPLESLKGHVDLSRPVAADFAFTRPPEGAPPQETTP